jgi:hypothetical protein
MKRGIYGLVAISIVGAGLWFLRGCNRKEDTKIAAPVLAPTDNAKVVIDPKHHRITTITRTGPVKETYLPPHVTSVTIDKSGKVTVHARAWGTEASPFIGFGYSDRTRLVVGVGLLYWHNWEGNLAVAPTISGPFSIRLAALVSYNVYSNTSLYVGVDHTKSPIGGVAFKF